MDIIDPINAIAVFSSHCLIELFNDEPCEKRIVFLQIVLQALIGNTMLSNSNAFTTDAGMILVVNNLYDIVMNGFLNVGLTISDQMIILIFIFEGEGLSLCFKISLFIFYHYFN